MPTFSHYRPVCRTHSVARALTVTGSDILLGDGGSTTSVVTLLPHAKFDGVWDSCVPAVSRCASAPRLYFSDKSNVKQALLDYITTTLLFSDKTVDSQIISWNRVILLHGPPGTGTAQLCGEPP